MDDASLREKVSGEEPLAAFYERHHHPPLDGWIDERIASVPISTRR